MSKQTTLGRKSDVQKADHIRTVVLKAGDDLRARHPWLQHQDAIGATVMVVSLPCLTFSGPDWLRNAMQQCQVLNPWWLMPLQLFCFNFGSAHAIHHFAVNEPFCVRQWGARIAHQVMREMGVRFNDFGTFRRANRFHMQAVHTAWPAAGHTT